jgi:hypothetical protein
MCAVVLLLQAPTWWCLGWEVQQGTCWHSQLGAIAVVYWHQLCAKCCAVVFVEVCCVVLPFGHERPHLVVLDPEMAAGDLLALTTR